MDAHRQGVGHGEEQHHEHKPVIKKVKDKVKKMKEKMKKRGHDNEDEHEETHSNTTEEDYDDETVQGDPAVHGAHPHFNDSVGAKDLVGGRDENLGGRGKVNFGEDREVMAKTTADQDSSMPKWDQSAPQYPSVAEDQRGKQSHDVVNSGEKEGTVEEDSAAPPNVRTGTAAGGMEEDPAAPPKVRTGTAAGATTDQFRPSDRSSVERTDNNTTSPNVNLEAISGRVEEDPVWGATAEHYTPTHPTPTGGRDGRDDVGISPILNSFKGMAISDKPKSTESTQSTTEKTHEDQPMQESGQEQKSPSSYTEKLSSTAKAVKGAAIPPAVGFTEYGKKIANTVYGTVSGVGSKGKTEREIGEGEKVGETDEGVSIKEYVVGKLSPGEEDRALSEVLSEMVRTKKQEVVGPTQSTVEKTHKDQPMQESGQEQKLPSSYTEKLSSTATGVKDAAMSAAIGSTEYGKKIANTVYGTVSGVGSKGNTEGKIGEGEKVGETDKGVSLKEYVVGKPSPGEKDSSETEHTKKQEVMGTGTEEGSGGKGMVEKIKGAVGSWIGAGSKPGGAAGAHEIAGGEKETPYPGAQKDLKQ